MTRSRFSRPLLRRGLALAGTVALGVGLSACGGSSSDSAGGGDAATAANPKTLKFGYHAGEKTPIGQLWVWWMDEVEAKTDGAIKFDRYWDGTLVKGTEMIEALNDGRVDVTQVMPTLYGSKFPVTSVHELPFQSSNSPAVSETMRQLGNEDGPVRAEFTKEKIVPLAWAIGGSSALGTKKPVTSAASLKGMRIRGNDRSSQVFKASGASVINMELAEVYGSLDRGLINGVYGVPFGFIGPLKYSEVVKNFTDTGMGVASANALSVSQKLWDSLTDDQRSAIDEINKQVPEKVGEFDAQFDELSCKAVKAAGAKLFVLPEPEVAKLRSAGEAGVVSDWKKVAASSGADADAVLREYQAKVKESEPSFPDYKTGVASCAASSAS